MATKAKTTPFGDALVEGLGEAVAWKRGEIALDVVNIDPIETIRDCVRTYRTRAMSSD
jgi:putative transcriptional regulator